jgi:hypothetical protein
MTESTPHLAHGDEYIVFYSGGPYDGQSDRRISTDGVWETEITVLAAFDGKETQVDYVSPVAKTVGDQVQVTYVWDPKDSEASPAVEERYDA